MSAKVGGRERDRLTLSGRVRLGETTNVRKEREEASKQTGFTISDRGARSA